MLVLNEYPLKRARSKNERDIQAVRIGSLNLTESHGRSAPSKRQKGGEMKHLFWSGCKVKNNEEYRAVLKKRQAVYAMLILAGLATEGLVLFLYFLIQIHFGSYQLGFLLGLGAGLTLGSVIGLVRIQRRMADEEKLKEFRLKETDEREVEVDSLALRATAKTLLVALYVTLIAAGVFNRKELVHVCLGLVALFLFGYTAYRKYYETKI